jgi:hypothetical protein
MLPPGALPYMYVVVILNLIIFAFAMIVQGVAFVHCLTQRSDGFPAIGTLPKGAWLAIIGVCFVLTYLFFRGDSPGIIALIGMGAAGVYLLDVRTGLRDLSDGKGFW